MNEYDPIEAKLAIQCDLQEAHIHRLQAENVRLRDRLERRNEEIDELRLEEQLDEFGLKQAQEKAARSAQNKPAPGAPETKN
jgi:hypothetical protein